MEQSLREESARLARSWMRHEPAMLRDYLVAGVEDPRLNVQSILSRHHLIRILTGNTHNALMREELLFAACLNWLIALGAELDGAEAWESILYALQHGSDNAEGTPISRLVLQAYGRLAKSGTAAALPNYVEHFVRAKAEPSSAGKADASEAVLNCFQRVWSDLSALESSLWNQSSAPVRVLEPACGSANDYRFLRAYGIAQHIDYSGIDICEKNVLNARTFLPDTGGEPTTAAAAGMARFLVGNVLELTADSGAYAHCFVHDLFEHLSLNAIERAVEELCRVTNTSICAHFFNMREQAEHVIEPLDEYHWNLLSASRMRQLFARHGFQAQVLHIGTFLRQEIGAEKTHNPDAYTFLLWRS